MRQGRGRPRKGRDARLFPTLRELGISKQLSSDCQKLAAIPEAEFERRLAAESGATDVSREKPRDDLDSEWQRKGATLSDKTARKEFGLTQEEIVRTIRAGTLRYRLNSVFGNPFLRLLRREVEALVKKKHGSDYLMGQGEDGVGPYQSRGEAAENSDRRVGKTEVRATRRPRELTAPVVIEQGARTMKGYFSQVRQRRFRYRSLGWEAHQGDGRGAFTVAA